MTEVEIKFAAALADMENPSKDSDNPHFKSRYASLGAVLDTVKPCLAKHGLVPYQRVEPWGDHWMLCTYVIAKDGERLQVDVRPFSFSGTPQQNGSEETYLRRYALMCCMGLTAEDDDANDATSGAVKRRESGDNAKDELLSKLRKVYRLWRDKEGLTDEQAQLLCQDLIGKPIGKDLTINEMNELLKYMGGTR